MTYKYNIKFTQNNKNSGINLHNKENIKFTQKSGINIHKGEWKQSKAIVLNHAISIANKYPDSLTHPNVYQNINKVADSIQRTLNEGKLDQEKIIIFFKKLIQYGLTTDDANLLIADLTIIAKHNNNNQYTTKINWFGISNKTASMQDFMRRTPNTKINTSKSLNQTIAPINRAKISSAIANSLDNKNDSLAAAQCHRNAAKLYIKTLPQTDRPEAFQDSLNNQYIQCIRKLKTFMTQQINTPDYDKHNIQIKQILCSLQKDLKKFDHQTFYIIFSELGYILNHISESKYTEIKNILILTLNQLNNFAILNKHSEAILNNYLNKEKKDLVLGVKALLEGIIKKSNNPATSRECLSYHCSFTKDIIPIKLFKLSDSCSYMFA
ncbi:MAG: hypothetical protein ACK5Z5_04400 [Neisseriaceae bacterium]